MGIWAMQQNIHYTPPFVTLGYSYYTSTKNSSNLLMSICSSWELRRGRLVGQIIGPDTTVGFGVTADICLLSPLLSIENFSSLSTSTSSDFSGFPGGEASPSTLMVLSPWLLRL